MGRRLHVILLLGFALLAPGAAAQRARPRSGGAAAVRAAIDARWTRFNELAKAGNTSAMAAMYAADASLMEPASPTTSGRARLGQAMHDWFANAKYFGRTRTVVSLDVSGDLAVEAGRFSESYEERGKPRVTNEGRYLVVWRRVRGVWLVQRDVELPDGAGAPRP